MNWLQEQWAGLKALLLGQSEMFLDVPAPAPQSDPRRYRAPDGLTPRLLERYERVQRAKRIGMGVLQAEYWLWRLLNQRCPETRVGQWAIRITGNREFFVEEEVR